MATNGFGRLAAKAQRGTVAVKQTNVVYPINGWFKPQSERRDDAVGAISVVNFLNVRAMQFNDLGRFFQCDDANHGHVACVFQNAVAHAASACVAACDKAANRGNIARAGVHQDFLAAGY